MIAVVKRWAQRSSRTAVILAAAAAVLVVANGVLFFFWQSQQAVDGARTAAVAAASQDVPALLSYSYSSFDHDLAQAEAGTTDHFRGEYGNLMTGQVEAAAKQHQVVTEATVSAASVVSAQPGAATLLMFLNQQSKTNAKAESVLNDIAVRVVMHKVNGTWLVDDLVPRA